MAYLISTRCHSISQRPLILIFKRGRIVIDQLNGASMRAMELELDIPNNGNGNTAHYFLAWSQRKEEASEGSTESCDKTRRQEGPPPRV